MERRVVITGMGIVSPLGFEHQVVLNNLLCGVSGVTVDTDYLEQGFGSTVSARVSDLTELTKKLLPDRRSRRFHGDGKTLPLGHVAAELAVCDAGLTRPDLSGDPRIGCIVGTGGPSTQDQVHNSMLTINNGSPKKIGPFAVPPTMSSGLNAVLATDYGIQGTSFSVTSACATSSHVIGESYLKIKYGLQEVIIAGGADDAHWTKAQGFDAMRALCRDFNYYPGKASRAFDAHRAGFVEGEAGAIVILEEYERARQRGAKIYAELIGYGATADGSSMVEPSGEGAVRCMRDALEIAGLPVVDYVNTHGTSTKVGDIAELSALARVFGDQQPLVTSTKSQTGHALGGAGAAEVIYSILMAEAGTIGPSINIDELDPEIKDMGWDPYIPREAVKKDVKVILSNSFGFGGTNASLVLKV